MKLVEVFFYRRFFLVDGKPSPMFCSIEELLKAQFSYNVLNKVIFLGGPFKGIFPKSSF